LRRLAANHPVIQIQGAAVGIVTACVLWTRLGDPNNYPSAEAYRKAMGLNLAQRSSGQYKGQLHISKRGDRLVRRWLHLAALRMVREHVQVRDWYRQKRIRDGGRHLGALTAVVRRLAIALHKAATRNEPLDGARLFPGRIPQPQGGR
jgi:transposase